MNDRSHRRSHPRGREAEEFAAIYLRAHGYRIRETNVRFRGGEIDIVAEDGATLAFVEVRARRPSVYGGPEESIGTLKQQRMHRAAEEYLARHHADADRPSRIDVVAIELDRDGRPASVDLIRNALE